MSPVPGRPEAVKLSALGVTDYYFSHVNREVAAAVKVSSGFLSVKQGMEVREIRTCPGWKKCSLPLILSPGLKPTLSIGKTWRRYPSGYGPSVFSRLSSGSKSWSCQITSEALKIKENAVKDFKKGFCGSRLPPGPDPAGNRGTAGNLRAGDRED